MNVPQKPKPFREGFVDEKERPAPRGPATIEHEPAPVAPEPEPEVATESWPITVKLLHHAIRNNTNVMIRELTFREPTGGDINRYGNPVRINQDGDVVWDERKMTYMIAALADVLPPFIEDMHPRDWNTAAMKLRNFFLPDPRAW